MNPSDSRQRSGPTIIPRARHGISRSGISDSALKVLYRLKQSGYMAFLVGGGVRDLLLGLKPKDFDVATDAHPEQIREVFRNSRLIGRRFRLAHVRFGRDIVEVATFRAAANDADDDRSHDDSGRILRDNVYGSIDEDIWRRDFTVNALYYNIEDFSVWDYTGGMADLEQRTLRLIDDPWTRYREDPVRMLRAVRFAAKLEFTIAPDTAAPIADLAYLLADVPAARLFDEVLKLFHSGHAVRSFDLLVGHGLLRYLFPDTDALLRGPDGEAVAAFIRRGLGYTDARFAEDKSLTPMYLYAVLLWPVVAHVARQLHENGETEYAAMQEALTRITAGQVARTALPKRFGVPMKEMLMMQRRFGQRRGARANRLVEHKRFRAALDLLRLRSECGEVAPDVADWWEARVAGETDGESGDARSGRRRRSRRGGRRRARTRPAESAGS